MWFRGVEAGLHRPALGSVLGWTLLDPLWNWIGLTFVRGQGASLFTRHRPVPSSGSSAGPCF